jgi:Phytanoyl-CoA dioxygenase (PhyH)
MRYVWSKVTKDAVMQGSGQAVAKDLPSMNIPWVESPFFNELLAQSNIGKTAKAELQFFHDNGFLRFDPKIPNFDEVADKIITALVGRYEFGRIQDAWVFQQEVKQLATAPKVLELLRLIYGREPIPFQTLNFPVGTQQATHSDTIHFHSIPHRFMCGVWVALEDIDDKNGPLHYYPGSHKLPIYDYNDLGLNGSEQNRPYEHYPAYERFVALLMQEHGFTGTNLNLKKGEALIWSANLFHGGSPILDSSRTRHSQVTHYFFEGCSYYTPMLSDPFLRRIFRRKICNIGTGEIVSHFYNGQWIDVPEEGLVTDAPVKETAVEESIKRAPIEVILPVEPPHQPTLSKRIKRAMRNRLAPVARKLLD